jgi:ribose 5-phosphate isomerase A
LADQDSLKQAAAEKALELVRDGMLVGLGSGSTVRYFTEGVGRLIADGMRLRGVPTSRATAALAAELGIPVVEDLVGPIDLAVDGADEVDPSLGLIKGRGGALLREKLVAAASRRFVCVVDESKVVDRLGQGVLPVEVLPFLWRTTAERLARLCTGLRVRGGEEDAYVTDNGNLILDLSFDDGIQDASELASALKGTIGVVEHGLFLGMAAAAYVACTDGVRVLQAGVDAT